jgi:hypothetical protein
LKQKNSGLIDSEVPLLSAQSVRKKTIQQRYMDASNMLTEPLGVPLAALAKFIVLATLLGVLVLYQLFYNGRVCARLVSRLLQRSFGAHYVVRVGSMNVALIGGRLIFSELLYATQNITLRVVDGSISFRFATTPNLYFCLIFVVLSNNILYIVFLYFIFVV